MSSSLVSLRSDELTVLRSAATAFGHAAGAAGSTSADPLIAASRSGPPPAATAAVGGES
jgi:hypothetical protein